MQFFGRFIGLAQIMGAPLFYAAACGAVIIALAGLCLLLMIRNRALIRARRLGTQVEIYRDVFEFDAPEPEVIATDQFRPMADAQLVASAINDANTTTLNERPSESVTRRPDGSIRDGVKITVDPSKAVKAFDAALDLIKRLKREHAERNSRLIITHKLGRRSDIKEHQKIRDKLDKFFRGFTAYSLKIYIHKLRLSERRIVFKDKKGRTRHYNLASLNSSKVDKYVDGINLTALALTYLRGESDKIENIHATSDIPHDSGATAEFDDGTNYGGYGSYLIYFRLLKDSSSGSFVKINVKHGNVYTFDIYQMPEYVEFTPVRKTKI